MGFSSPSPGLTSSEATALPSQSHQSDERHRSSLTSSSIYDDSRQRPVTHIGGQHSPASAGPPSYLASPVYSTGHSQMHLSSLLESTNDTSLMQGSHGSPPQVTRRTTEAATPASDDSVGCGSSATGGVASSQTIHDLNARESFDHPTLSSHRQRGSVIAATFRDEPVPEIKRVQNSLYKAPSADCRYRCLDPVLPYLRDIIPASVACDLLDVYLTEPGSSLFRCASPYIITRIFRQKSLLDPTNPRQTTPALLATMLWCSAKTADIVLLHVPGSRVRGFLCNCPPPFF